MGEVDERRMPTQKAIAGLIALGISFFAILFGGAIVSCRIGAHYLDLEMRFSLRGGCELRKDGEWQKIKDIIAPREEP